MYLFLKFEQLIKIVSNIGVDDDCVPIVNGKAITRSPTLPTTPRPGAESPLRQQHPVPIEAIPWFKSQVVEAVYIDCGSRDACWVPKTVMDQLVTAIPDPPSVVEMLKKKKEEKESTRKKEKEKDSPKVSFTPPTARPLFRQGGGESDFDPTADEMFERAERILVQSSSQKFSEEEVMLECAQLLHCCVFPAIIFQKADIPLLQGCTRRCTIKIRSLEKEIIEKENAITVQEVALTKHKDRIIATGEFSSESYVRACRQDFVDAFYVHVMKDVPDKNMNLEIVQRKINNMRKSEPDSSELERIVKERDLIHERLALLMTIRETIRNVLYRPHVPRKKKLKKKVSEENLNLYQVFVETDCSLRSSRDELKRLYYRKLHFAAMREAIDSTIKMVESGSFHGSCDFSEFSVIIQEQGNERSSHTWTSLQGKVDDIMETKESSIYTIHMERCQLIKDLIQSIISDQMVPVRRSAPVILNDSHNMEPIICPGFETDQLMSTFPCTVKADSHLSVRIQRATSDQLIMSVKNQVVSHIWDIAKRVVIEVGLNPNSARHANRAWLCYIPYFCHEALETFEALYSHVHGANVRALHHNVANLALADIVDDKFFEDFFMSGLVREDAESKGEAWEMITVPRVKSSNSLTAVSLDLQRCSVTELYAMADRDCAKLCQEMLDLDPQSRPSESPVHDSGEDNPEGSSCQHNSSSDTENNRQQQLSRTSSISDSGGSIHSDDLFSDFSDSPEVCQRTESASLRSSQTVQSVLGMFESVVQPFNSLVQQAVECPDLLGKLRIICQSTTFLNQKVEQHCTGHGMDSLLPMSIFATVSLREELFVRFYIQLLMLIDLKPDFFLHSIYDFSLTSAYTPYLFLFDRKVTNSVVHSSV